MGVAILKLDSFGAKMLEDNYKKQDAILLTSPILFVKDLEKIEDFHMDEIISFGIIDDEGLRFLKDLKFEIKKEFKDKVFVFSSKEDKESYMDYGDLIIKYGDLKINYIWMEESEE
jgi:hypothetical protein